MRIAGLQKLTLLDYPGNIAAIIFTKGCNFNCGYCQNSSLILNDGEELIDELEILKYLEKRRKILDAVVISGGEPTIQKDLKSFIIKIKNMGFKVKLDTNGYNPNLLEELINDNLLDYVAMDIKADLNNYERVACKKINVNNILRSISLLKESNIAYEFRTTVIKGIHDINMLENILNIIGEDSKYYIQNFEESQNVLDKSLSGFSKEELQELKERINRKHELTSVRGLYSEIGGKSYV